MKLITALIRGIIEYRNDITTNYEGRLLAWYDTGRQLAKTITKGDK